MEPEPPIPESGKGGTVKIQMGNPPGASIFPTESSEQACLLRAEFQKLRRLRALKSRAPTRDSSPQMGQPLCGLGAARAGAEGKIREAELLEARPPAGFVVHKFGNFGEAGSALPEAAWAPAARAFLAAGPDIPIPESEDSRSENRQFF